MSIRFISQTKGLVVGKKKKLWPELCELVSHDDGLPTRKSGPWAEDKLYFWSRYIDIATSGMVKKWPEGLIYLDLFAGPGVCSIRKTNRRVPGSPLIAAHASTPFQKILLCERDPANAQACEQRLRQSPAKNTFKLFCGDCNDQVAEIVKEIPPGALTLAFLDPTGLHAKIDTIRELSRVARVDLLILFPDAIDVIRNVETYLPQLDSKLDQVLGPGSNWREEWQALGGADGSRTRRKFADLYKQQLEKHANYKFFGEEVIKGPKGPLYRLVFASKHERGLEFWDKVTKEELGGQKRMGFD